MSDTPIFLSRKTPGPRRRAATMAVPDDPPYAMLRKTFTETYFLMVGAWGVLLLWTTWVFYKATEGFTHNGGFSDPLKDSAFLELAYVGCAVMGGLFGMIQFRPLNAFDQWAFLMQRPIARTRLFLIMSGAGLSMYGGTIFVPLMFLFCFAILHTSLASMLYLDFTYPYVAAALAGVPCYFLGAVIVQRRARWFGTRFLPLFAGVVMVGLAASLRYFSVVVIVEVAGAVAFGLAAWSSTISQGEDRRVPWAARAGTWVALWTGCAFFAYFIGAMGVAAVESYAQSVLPDLSRVNAPVLNQISTDVSPAVLSDGRVVVRLATFRYVAVPDGAYPGAIRAEAVSVKYVTLKDQAVPNGIAAVLVPIAIFDLSPPTPKYTYREPGVADGQEKEEVIAPPPGMPALASGETLRAWNNIKNESGLDLQVGLTSRHLYVFDPRARELIATLPLNHSLTLYRVDVDVDVEPHMLVVRYSRLARKSFATWSAQAAGHPYQDRYTEVYDRGGKLLNSIAYDESDPVFVKYHEAVVARKEHLAALRPYRFVMGMIDAAGMSMNALPLERWSTLRQVFDADSIYWDWDAFRGTILVNVLTAMALIGLGRWYGLSGRTILAWTVAGAILGPLTLLIFAGFHGRPVRVVCGHCAKRRPVEEVRCPHCQSPFPAPACNGTEIISGMTSASTAAVADMLIRQPISGGGAL